ncbi:MAG: GTPase HflX [Thermoplasmata archaeon]|nr:GTPase HflX [Thermoplasmata archaeon]
MRKDVAEISELIRTMGYSVRECIIQNRNYPDRKYYVGEGKIREIKKKLAEANVESLVINDPLEPAQIYHIERETGARVIDRTLLILEIFMRNANSVEAKLQVELAKLQYEIPLMREYVHRYKTGEHSGAYAGGEYMVDQYYNLIKRRAAKIRRMLEKYRKARELQRARRKELNYISVALAGYTNAGKTTLLNALAQENAYTDDRMFTTLSTLVRRINNSNLNLLLVDTVGFIDGMPLYIIDAFRATYEEIQFADVVLLLVDGSDAPAEIVRKMQAVVNQINQYMARFGNESQISKRMVYVITKADLIDGTKLAAVLQVVEMEMGVTPVVISAKTGEGLDALVRKIMAVSALDKETAWEEKQ